MRSDRVVVLPPLLDDNLRFFQAVEDNFVRIHQTLKITPAMAASVTDKLWEMSDMVKVLEDWETAN